MRGAWYPIEAHFRPIYLGSEIHFWPNSESELLTFDFESSVEGEGRRVSEREGDRAREGPLKLVFTTIQAVRSVCFVAIAWGPSSPACLWSFQISLSEALELFDDREIVAVHLIGELRLRSNSYSALSLLESHQPWGFWWRPWFFVVIGKVASLCTRFCYNKGPSANLYASFAIIWPHSFPPLRFDHIKCCLAFVRVCSSVIRAFYRIGLMICSVSPID